MIAVQALRRTVVSLWEDIFLLLGTGLLGGFLVLLPLSALLALVVLPWGALAGAAVLFLIAPFFLGGYYGLGEQLALMNVVGWGDWLRAGRDHAAFFYKWFLLAGVVLALLGTNTVFYWQLEAAWAQAAGGLAVGLFMLWLLPQPFVPALYLKQETPGLLLALRNAYVVALGDPFSVLVMWLLTALLVLLALNLSWVILLPAPVVVALYSSNVVALRLAREEEEDPPQRRKER